jgi:type IV secretion system protein VirB4
MLRLSEYRSHPDRLADHLPWALLIAPGIVLNKDGSFQKSFRFCGPDLESATQAELISATARLNNVLRRFGTGWALFFEAERFEAPEVQLSGSGVLAGGRGTAAGLSRRLPRGPAAHVPPIGTF